jgi:hypothetical protein
VDPGFATNNISSFVCCFLHHKPERVANRDSLKNETGGFRRQNAGNEADTASTMENTLSFIDLARFTNHPSLTPNPLPIESPEVRPGLLMSNGYELENLPRMVVSPLMGLGLSTMSCDNPESFHSQNIPIQSLSLTSLNDSLWSTRLASPYYDTHCTASAGSPPLPIPILVFPPPDAPDASHFSDENGSYYLSAPSMDLASPAESSSASSTATSLSPTRSLIDFSTSSDEDSNGPSRSARRCSLCPLSYDYGGDKSLKSHRDHVHGLRQAQSVLRGKLLFTDTGAIVLRELAKKKKMGGQYVDLRKELKSALQAFESGRYIGHDELARHHMAFVEFAGWWVDRFRCLKCGEEQARPDAVKRHEKTCTGFNI